MSEQENPKQEGSEKEESTRGNIDSTIESKQAQEPQNNTSHDNEEELVSLEAKLLEQEHRFFAVWYNFLWKKNKWDKDDPRRKAVLKALLFLFVPSRTLLITGGLVSLLTLILMDKQNKLLDAQNELFKLQNLRIDQQTNLEEASRRSTQTFIMGEVLSDLNKELNNIDNKEKTISSTLIGRIISLSLAMKPYRYLENDSLIPKPLSPERGQLLITLLNSNMNNEFLKKEILEKANFTYADLTRAPLSNADLEGINLSHANFSQADVQNVNFTNAKLFNSDLSDANLRSANLTSTYFIGANLYNANLDKATLVRTNFKDANLTDAYMSARTLFNEVYFYNANLSKISFKNSRLERVDLSKAQLKKY
jgi:uncharacterized protein YjbI with pentapeptide repeats